MANYRLTLEHGEYRQEILRWPGVTLDAVPTLIWAGDLNRDGRLDLLMETANHYRKMELTLFLSTAEGSGDFVFVATRFTTVDCD